MTRLKLENINKSFGKTHILSALSFQLSAEKTLSILGKSGCGKTTLLKIIAGLIKADAGKIFLNGQEISDWKPAQRNAVYLYQEDLLFPHLTVFQNIAFGLEIKKFKHPQIKKEVDTIIGQLELEGQADKYPHQLSGGQRQRVSFGRAIITQPTLLLLDEPFGSLDSQTRQSMQALFKQIAEAYRITSIFITHDLKEALLMGDQIGLMQNGQLKIYQNIKEFIDDDPSGVKEEIKFWSNLNN